MRRTLEIVQQAAPSVATVLLLGESGTGKELLARQIHELSPRAGRAFVPVNCAAIPEDHPRGRAVRLREGRLHRRRRSGATAASRQADGGTLFLDEIGEIPLSVQVKLLRVLQEGEIERLGGKSHKIDIRLVAATNQDLRKRAVAEGRFREDLYYRLNVIAVHVPPLRDRRDDMPLLVEHFLARFREKNGKAVSGCTRAALDALTALRLAGQRARAGERHRARRRAHQVGRHRRRGSAARGARGAPPRRRAGGGRTRAHLRDRHAARRRSSCA